ncbi:hypothetical protein PCANC_01509 [Puccinia coronata f. sp. avenae]|uniref:DUF659 domain-containing protein n=1 Tax=Puccinia coronata f. sp. avenae TaxID=200324 RepID=A0A2N5W2R3_9BASI|nr:hypothetical protein PCANC_01509 [Puccinia coronata f. sp. avenae]
MIYSAVQHEYKSVLKAHNGVLYLGVDAWQSPNGFNILGVVIYQLADDDSGNPKLEAVPLDFIRLAQSHTGDFSAQKLVLVVEKFEIQHKICGIVSDNASNNTAMVSKLKKEKWAHFKVKPQWIQCFAHVLNLIVQGILRPFGTQKKNDSKKMRTMDDQYSEDNSDAEDEDTNRHIQVDDPSSDNQHSKSKAELIIGNNKDNTESLSLDNIENMSDEGESNTYTTDGCRETLAKFCVIAKKLRYSPNSKIEFVQICREKECPTTHTIERDRHKRYGVYRKYHLEHSDFDLAQDLVEVLNLFHEITLQISMSGLAQLANIVAFIDQITDHLSTAISGKNYPPALRNACWVGLQITTKYCSLTDSSPLFRIAILLHPLLRDKYLKLAQWEPEWISEAIRLARDMWLSIYKPSPVAPSLALAATVIHKQKTGTLAGLGEADAARGGNCLTDPLDIWLAEALILNDNKPVNPLKWWLQQKRIGNTHGGLLQMALDVLSCPGGYTSSTLTLACGTTGTSAQSRGGYRAKEEVEVEMDDKEEDKEEEDEEEDSEEDKDKEDKEDKENEEDEEEEEDL